MAANGKWERRETGVSNNPTTMRADRDAEAEYAECDPPQRMPQHPHRHRPGEHGERRREENAVAGDRDAGRDNILPQGNGPSRRVDRQGDAKQRQAEQQAGRDRDHDEAGIEQAGGSQMDTAADQVQCRVEEVRPGYQNHAWADCDEAQRRTQIEPDRQRADDTGENCRAEWLDEIAVTDPSDRAAQDRASAGAHEYEYHRNDMPDAEDDREGYG